MVFHDPGSHEASQLSRLWQVFTLFLRLGLTSFGGPVAHIGYFRETFVRRLNWLSEAAFADLVAICHVMPGPSSSQVGMAIGLQRAGIAGMLTAWFAFTMPSAVVIVLFAQGATFSGQVQGVIAGLKAVAVAVVAHAVLGMVRSLGTGWRWGIVAIAAFVVSLLMSGVFIQVLVIAAAGLCGLWLLPRPTDKAGHSGFGVRVPRGLAVTSLVVFGGLLIGTPILARFVGNPSLDIFDAFYRAGALVFGGGHVVLPLLEAETVRTGLIDADTFLAGYGVAQALPGPLFTFAAYLGYVTGIPSQFFGAVIALFAIFLPAMLLVLGVLPFWGKLGESIQLRRTLSGVNAGVVGLLAAAFVNPVAAQGVPTLAMALIAVIVFVSLQWGKISVWLIVLLAAIAGYALY